MTPLKAVFIAIALVVGATITIAIIGIVAMTNEAVAC